MLSIAKLSGSPAAAAYYLEVIANGRDDYYVASGEAPGRWRGSAAARLGLSGEVARDALQAVLDGRHPATGARLVTRRVPGFDLTLSAPKSVSLLWGLGDRHVASAVLAAHDAAVAAAMAYFEEEEEACVVRRGPGGATHLSGGGLVAAAFVHRTSREADPNLHTHLVTANMTVGPDGRWSALHTTDPYRHGRTAGFVYQSALRHELVGGGSVKLTHYQLVERLGVRFEPAGPGVGEVAGIPVRVRRAFSRRRVAIEESMAAHGGHSARGAQAATLGSRPAKREILDEPELRRGWARRAAEAGFDGAIPTGAARRASEITDDDLGRRLTRQDATFDRRQLVRSVAESATQGLDHDAIGSRVDAFLAGTEVVEVASGRWTTPEMLALDAARAAWHETGLRCRGATLAARAARELESGSGIPSQTIASLLRDHNRGTLVLTRYDVLAVDEAGMVGTRDLQRLVHASTTAGAKLVLVGDPKQLSEIEAGGLFASLARRLGHTELTENRRVHDRAQQASARALRERDAMINTALRRLEHSGALTLDTNADRLRQRMTDDWYGEHAAGRHTVMLALHRHDVADFNHRARQHRAAAGHLGPTVFENGDLELRVGDRVLALRNDRRIGLVNGTMGTIVGGNHQAVEIEGRDGARCTVPIEYVTAGHLTHGYAITIHKSQGMTCDVALVLGEDTLYREAGYTSITRGRDRNHVYALAALEPGQPTSVLRRALTHSTAKQTAHDRGGLGL